jgi:phospholipid-translocating ATPase
LDKSLISDYLGPRFIVKYIRAVYFPLDKEIIREMWVDGDLKDRLGIRHRKASKNRNQSLGTLEAAPIFREPHNRSFSESSNRRQLYELAPSSTPPLGGTTRPTYLDTPPMRQRVMPVPPDLSAQASNIQAKHQPDTHPPVGSVLSPEQLQVPAHRTESHSPSPSYYSASDIPPPSPLPETLYRYPTGEVTSVPPSNRTSVYTVTGRTSLHSQPPSIPNPFPFPLPSSSRHQPQSLSSSHMGEYPMSLLDGGEGRKTAGPEVGRESSSRPRLEVDDSVRPDSELSYRTDDFQTAEDHEVEEHPQPRSSYGGGWRMSNASISGYSETELPTPRQSQYIRDDDDPGTVEGSQTNYVGQAL